MLLWIGHSRPKPYSIIHMEDAPTAPMNRLNETNQSAMYNQNGLLWRRTLVANGGYWWKLWRNIQCGDLMAVGPVGATLAATSADRARGYHNAQKRKEAHEGLLPSEHASVKCV